MENNGAVISKTPKELRKRKLRVSHLVIAALITGAVGGFLLLSSRAATVCEPGAVNATTAAQVRSAVQADSDVCVKADVGDVNLRQLGNATGTVISTDGGSMGFLDINDTTNLTIRNARFEATQLWYANGTTIENSTIGGTSANRISANLININVSPDVTIRNNEIAWTTTNPANATSGYGIRSPGNSLGHNHRLKIEGNYIHHIAADGIQGLGNTSENVVIDRNRIDYVGKNPGSDEHSDAVQIIDHGPNLRFTNNWLSHEGYFAQGQNEGSSGLLYVHGGSNGTMLVENNFFSDSRGRVLFCGLGTGGDSLSNLTFRNNTVLNVGQNYASFPGLHWACTGGSNNLFDRNVAQDDDGGFANQGSLAAATWTNNLWRASNAANALAFDSLGNCLSAACNPSGQSVIGYRVPSGVSWGEPSTPPPPPADTTAPTVSLTAPAASATVSGASVSVTANASDDTGVSGVQFKLDGNNLGTEDTSSPYAVNWDTTTIANGTHALTAVARDAAGNSTTSSARTVTVNNVAPDTTPPNTTITTMPANPTSSTGASFNFSSTESNSTFECKLDNGSYASCTTPKSYSGLTIGSHSFSVRATDPAGNQDASAASYSWTIIQPPDTTNPTVSFTTPTNGATVSGIVTSTIAASDSVGVTRVEISLDDSLKMTDTDSPYNYSFDSKTLTNGTHTLSAKAYDAAGNTATTTITITVNNPDVTPPNAPTGLSATAPNATTVNLSWSASTDTGTNPTGVVRYNVLRNGVVIAQPTTTSYSDTNRTANTVYSYVVQAVDGASNVSNNSNTATVTTPPPPVTPDTTSPTVPANLSATAASVSQVNLSWNASTDSGGSGLAGYNVYRGSTKLNGTPITTTTYGDSTVSPGTTYSYRVEAVDGAGNKSAQTSAVSVTTPQSIRGDVTGPNGVPDGKINLSDVSLIIRNYGTNNIQADVSGSNGSPDGKVDLFDISYVIRNYGG